MKTKVWQTNPNAPLFPGKWFSIWNIQSGKYVAYGKRKYGINLIWYTQNNQPRPNFIVARPSGATGAIKYGEMLALKEKKGGYLFYKKREYGINLSWSFNPIHEWEIRGGRTGQAVETQKLGDSPSYISDTLFSLYNKKAKAYVVYGKREYGINFVWDRSTIRDHR